MNSLCKVGEWLEEQDECNQLPITDGMGIDGGGDAGRRTADASEFAGVDRNRSSKEVFGRSISWRERRPQA